jgi:hypothetical protein
MCLDLEFGEKFIAFDWLWKKSHKNSNFKSPTEIRNPSLPRHVSKKFPSLVQIVSSFFRISSKYWNLNREILSQYQSPNKKKHQNQLSR